MINFPISNNFFINSLGKISAEEDTDDLSLNCCLEMGDGAKCQDIASTTPEVCVGTIAPTICDNTFDCKRGCCVDTEEGLCTPNSIAMECEGGEFYENEENCNIVECQKGCCVLGNNVKFVTEKRCEKLSLEEGFEKDWNTGTELECLALAASQNEGACILQGICSRKTEVDCLSEGGTPYIGYLCSHPELSEYNCIRQNSVGCYEGKDEIYWFDSCGNRENIYSSDNYYGIYLHSSNSNTLSNITANSNSNDGIHIELSLIHI